MDKTISMEYLQKELSDVINANEAIKAAAQMVGYNVDENTDRLLKDTDQRIRINLHMLGRIETLKSIIEECQL